MRLILASNSPRRKAILESKGYKFSIILPKIDESFNNELTVEENVLLISKKKAFCVKSSLDEVVLACDTIVAYKNKVYGKPKDDNDAYNTLKTLSGKRHEVISGVCILVKDKLYNFYVKSFVTFKDLSEKDILEYIETKECFDKAGSYAIQGIGKNLVSKYEGDLNNIIGLPIDDVSIILNQYLGECNEVEN